MKRFIQYTLFFALISISGKACADESLEGKYMREALILLAEEGTDEAYQEIDRILSVLTPDQPLFAGEYGYGEGKRSIEKTLSIIGDRGDQKSYNFLERVMRENFKNSGALDSEMWTYVLSNLLKYRESKSDELVDLIEEAMQANYEVSNRLLKDYPHVEKEELYYFFPKDDYVNKAGEIVYKNSINRGVRYDHLIDALRVIGSKQSYDLIADYFKSWVGREDTALMNNVEVHLKKNRYSPDVISIYETLFRDERNHPNTRTRIIVAFLTNKPVFYSYYVDNPEEFYPQLDELDQDRLLRILALADYALSRDFLPQETVDLIQSKRAEILKLLIAMGYEHEAATTDETVEEVAEAEQETQKPIKMVEPEPTEEPAEQSSKWWLWLIGAVVVVGGIGLIARRKS